jgi:hypothetical protein
MQHTQRWRIPLAVLHVDHPADHGEAHLRCIFFEKMHYRIHCTLQRQSNLQ